MCLGFHYKRLIFAILVISCFPIAKADVLNTLWDFESCIHEEAPTSDQMEKLIADTQDILVATLAKNGQLKNGFAMANDIESTEANVQILTDDKAKAAGIVFGLNHYSSDHARAQPRVFSLSELHKGVDIVKVKSRTYASLQSDNINPETGGILKLSYLADIKLKKMESVTIGLRKNNGKWEFFNPSTNSVLTHAKLITWMNVLTWNAGVKRVDF